MRQNLFTNFESRAALRFVGSLSLVLLVSWVSLVRYEAAGQPRQDRVVVNDSTILVHLDQFNIEMPVTETSAGLTLFLVTNGSDITHNFEIERRGNEKQRYSILLKPGETKTLQAELRRGSYSIYWPVPGIDERGYPIELSVS